MVRRIALVTGGNRGIGFEVCRQLKAKGLWVVLGARDAQKGQAAAQTLGVEFCPLDMADETSLSPAVEHILQQFGRLDVLVNNAAINYDDHADVLTNPLEMFRDTLQTNTWGPLRLCQWVLPQMVKQGYGRVVNVSSSMAQLSHMGNAAPAYSVSKTALNALTCMLADAVRGHNVLVNAIDPGWVHTDMGGPSAPRSPQEGAKSIVWGAVLPDGGPSGGFFKDGQRLAW